MFQKGSEAIATESPLPQLHEHFIIDNIVASQPNVAPLNVCYIVHLE